MTLKDIIGAFLPMDDGRRKIALGMSVESLLFAALMWGPGRGSEMVATNIVEAMVFTAGLVIGGNVGEWIAKRRASGA